MTHTKSSTPWSAADDDRSLDELLASLDRDPPEPRTDLARSIAAAVSAAEQAHTRPRAMHRIAWLSLTIAAALLIAILAWQFRLGQRETSPRDVPSLVAALRALNAESLHLHDQIAALHRTRLAHSLESMRAALAALEQSTHSPSELAAEVALPVADEPRDRAEDLPASSLEEWEVVALRRLALLQSTSPNAIGAQELRQRGQELARQYAGTWFAEEALRFTAALPY